MAPPPWPFGPEADSLALLRLQARTDGDFPVPPVFDPARPVLGLKVTVRRAESGGERTPASRIMYGEVVDIEARGFVVDLHDGDKPEPGASGAAVWLTDGRLLGLLSGVRADLKMLVAPARSLASLLSSAPRRVLVAGSGGKGPLPENVWRLADTLGWALARAGYVLVCSGWPGVDHIVARAFAAVVGDDAALASRFVQQMESGRSPDFSSSVPPTVVDVDDWAAQLSGSADALIALGRWSIACLSSRNPPGD